MSNKHVKVLIKISYAYIVCAVLFVIASITDEFCCSTLCRGGFGGIGEGRRHQAGAGNKYFPYVRLKYARINWQTLCRRRTRWLGFCCVTVCRSLLKCNRLCSTFIYDGNIIKNITGAQFFSVYVFFFFCRSVFVCRLVFVIM